MFKGEGTPDISGLVAQINSKPELREDFIQFFQCINLCHDCVIIENKQTGAKTINGPSVDEVCLLEMSKKVGLCYFEQKDSTFM